MLLMNNGGIVDASDEHAKVLLAAGWKPVEQPKKPAPRKRTARKAAPKKTTE